MEAILTVLLPLPFLQNIHVIFTFLIVVSCHKSGFPVSCIAKVILSKMCITVLFIIKNEESLSKKLGLKFIFSLDRDANGL